MGADPHVLGRIEDVAHAVALGAQDLFGPAVELLTELSLEFGAERALGGTVLEASGLTAEGGGASSGFAGLLGMALLAQIFALLVLFNAAAHNRAVARG